jgi:hypothetical protein
MAAHARNGHPGDPPRGLAAGLREIHRQPDKARQWRDPIQKRAARLLDEGGWRAQYRWPIADRSQPGRMDAAYLSSHGLVAFESETGNVASCHRSINKICLGFHIGAIAGGILALSSNSLYPSLTDRVGNIGEIERYFPLWSATPCDQGVLEIIVVEHDAISADAPLIPKGKEGWARLSITPR